MIRLTDTRPTCSACHTQHLDGTRFVDFYADHDAGWADGVSLDDLIVCELCVKAAAREVGYGDVMELERRLKESELGREREKHRADVADEYAAKLEDAMDSRPVQISHPRRRGRPPKEAVA